MSMQVVQQQGYSQVTSFEIPAAPAGDDSILTVTAEETGGMAPVGVASQWLPLPTGRSFLGFGPFSGTTITVSQGRTPPLVDRDYMELAPE